MSMIDGLRNVLGINQDPEADSYVDDNEEDDIFPGGGQGGSPAPEEAYPTQETAKQHSNQGGSTSMLPPSAGCTGQAGTF